MGYLLRILTTFWIATLASQSLAQATCGCFCVGGTMQAICTSATELAPSCLPSRCATPPSAEKNADAAATLSNETLQRAAYCYGVLGATVPKGIIVRGPDGRQFAFPAGTPDNVINARMGKTYGTGTNDAVVLPITEMTAQERNLHERLSRFERYYKLEMMRLIKGSADRTSGTQAAAIRKHGIDDAEQSARTLASDEYKGCLLNCRDSGAPKCLVDCVESFSPTAARVLACQTMPDGLPY